MTEITTLTIPVEDLVPSPTNPRKKFDQDTLQELANSMKAAGQLQAILVREIKPGKGRPPKSQKYEVVAGERRYRAASLAKLDTLRAEVRELTDSEVLHVQIIENLQRDDVHPMDEATAYSILIKDQTAAEIGKTIGKTESYVHKRMRLASLSKDMKKRYLSDKIRYIHAIQFARLTDDNQAKAWKALHQYEYHNFTDNKLTVSEAELRSTIGREIFHKISAGKFDPKDAKLTKAGACASCPLNTACSPLLFDDVKEAQCTDPKCYKDKEKTTFTNSIKKLEQKHPDAIHGGNEYGHIKAGGKAYPEHKTGAKSPGKKWQPVIITKASWSDNLGTLAWVDTEAKQAKSDSNASNKAAEEKAERVRKIDRDYEAKVFTDMLAKGFEVEPPVEIKTAYVDNLEHNIGGAFAFALLLHFDMIKTGAPFDSAETFDALGWEAQEEYTGPLFEKMVQQPIGWLFNVMEAAEDCGSYSRMDKNKAIRLQLNASGGDWDKDLKAFRSTRSAELNKEKKAAEKKAVEDSKAELAEKKKQMDEAKKKKTVKALVS